MKILVTVGTTVFDTLIEYIDKNISKDYPITLQIASGSYKPQNFEYFTYSDNFNDYIDSSDIIITHAGAGNVYNLLEKKKKIIVVPNLERKDKHQKDLAKYIDNMNYAFVAFDFKDIDRMLKKISHTKFKKYSKTKFFGSEEILRAII